MAAKLVWFNAYLSRNTASIKNKYIHATYFIYLGSYMYAVLKLKSLRACAT